MHFHCDELLDIHMQLSGSISRAAFVNAEPNLEELNLADNQFEGVILPYPSSTMTQIMLLDLSRNAVRTRRV